MGTAGLKRLKYVLVPRMRNKCLQDRGMTYNIAAAGFSKKGDLIDIRFNNHRMSHRKGASLHAEQDLIHLYGNRVHTIYILRVGGNGNFLPIHPCKTCAAIAKKRGIKIIPIHENINLFDE